MKDIHVKIGIMTFTIFYYKKLLNNINIQKAMKTITYK